jgi:hypothetical protein
MTIAAALEVWTARQALATRALLQQALLSATPIIAFIPERRYGLSSSNNSMIVKALIREGGLSRPPASPA